MLSLIASIYGKLISVRNRLYDTGVLATFDLGARTISIGNITTGGTGKTPLVAYVAGLLADRGEKVCILTRGYGRKDAKRRVLVSDGETVLVDAATGGDEPVELARKLVGKNVVVIADADRVAAAEWAKRKFGVTVFVLDDGFQHRRAKRDVDIVCIDAMTPFGGARILPAGRLREPLDNLGRADIIVITRCDLVTDISDLRSQISDHAPTAVINESTMGMTGFLAVDGSTVEVRREHGFAFCGLGNPEGFFEHLRRVGIQLAGTRAFADHHRYSQEDIDEIVRAARGVGAELLLTTAKDAVKFSDLRFEMPCSVVEITVELEQPDEFASHL